MATPARTVICTHCFVRRELVPIGRNFFPGCPRYRCSRCTSLFLQPISATSSAVGWTMFGLFATSCILGGLGLVPTDPLTELVGGAMALILLVGLVRDLLVRGGVAAAARAHARGEGGARE